MEFATTTNCAQAGKELCELFGFPSDKTTSLAIFIKPESVIEVQAKVFATKEQMLQMAQIVKRYQLLPLSCEEQ